MFKKIFAIILATVMIVSLAACGSTNSNDNKATEAATKAADAATEAQDESNAGDESQAPEESVAPSGSASESAQIDVLNVGIEADCQNFNPWTYSGTGANLMLFSLYQPLVYSENGEYYPAILESWEATEDSFTGKMFENIVDSEGNHMTADDIIFSWGKACEAFPENLTFCSGMDKIDEYTIKFNWSRELYVGEESNTVSRLYCVTEKAFNDSKDQMSTTPVGTGVYKMTDYTSGYMATYEKVENWWNEGYENLYKADHANADVINWYVLTESNQRTLALQQKTIDMCSSISAADVEQFDGKDGYQLYMYDENLSLSLFPNCDPSNICSDVNLRKAICYAIDNEAILNGAYNGLGTVMHAHAPEWSVGYNTAWNNEDNYYKYDVEEAKKLLADSKYNGESLRIITLSNPKCETAAQIVMNFLTQAGIKSEMVSYDSSSFGQYSKDAGSWDIMLYTRPTTTYAINAVYTTQSAERYDWGASLNFVYDDEYQDMIAECYLQSGNTQEHLDKLHQYIVDNCYVMGMVNGKATCVIPDDITEVVLSWRKTITPGACVFAE